MQSADELKPIQIRVCSDLYGQLEDFRRSEKDIPSRPQAVVRLIQHALRAATERRDAPAQKIDRKEGAAAA
jgi:hypothetical protein